MKNVFDNIEFNKTNKRRALPIDMVLKLVELSSPPSTLKYQDEYEAQLCFSAHWYSHEKNIAHTLLRHFKYQLFEHFYGEIMDRVQDIKVMMYQQEYKKAEELIHQLIEEIHELRSKD